MSELYEKIERHLREHDKSNDDYHIDMVRTCVMVLLKYESRV